MKEQKIVCLVQKTEAMSFEMADNNHPNPFFSLGGGFCDNCQSAVVAFEARLRGFKVRARAYEKNRIFRRLANNPEKAFINSETRKHPEWLENTNIQNGLQEFLFINETIKVGERYIFRYNRKYPSPGHVISIFRNEKSKLVFYDAQKGIVLDNEEVMNMLTKEIVYQEVIDGIKIDRTPRLLRVDILDFDINILKFILEASDE